MLLAVVFSLLSGLSFAVAGVLQQQAAASRPRSESLTPRLIGGLLRQRAWRVGIGLAVVAYLFQALALRSGPLIVTELLIAVPVSSVRAGLPLHARELAGLVAVAGGVALAVWAAAPGPGDTLPGSGGWAAVLVPVALLAGLAVAAGRRAPAGPMRASLFAFAGAVVMGTQSAAFKATVELLDRGIGTALASWPPYLLTGLSIAGLLLLQSAFQAGPLAASLPVVDVVEPAVALVIGTTVFDESIRAAGARPGIAAAAAAVAVVGVVLLDTSPVLRRRPSSQPDGSGPPDPRPHLPGSGDGGSPGAVGVPAERV